MKCYAIYPAFELVRDDERSRACIQLVSQIVIESLRRDGDDFHYVVDWLDPGAEPDSGTFHEDLAQPHIQQLSDGEALANRITQSIDPFSGMGSTIRSIAACRAVAFGYDGQAFLCVRHDDETPVTPDPALATVEEHPDYLTETDYFDGWVRGTPNVH